MTNALLVGAIVVALLLGIVVGRHWGSRGSGVRRRSAAGARIMPVPSAVSSGLADYAQAPREVTAGAELSENDVVLVTEDGRLTKAGLLSLIVRKTDTAIAVVDEFRDVVMYNHRALELGLVRDSLLADPVWQSARAVLETGEEENFEFTPAPTTLGFVSTGRTGGRKVEAVRANVRLVEFADESYAVVYGLDDTEHLRVEATRRDFVANVSHELKTPVGAIGLLGEALLESSDDVESVAHFGRKVVSESRRLGNLVAELIALSRLQGGETSVFAPVDVDELIAEAIDAASVTADAVGVTLQADGPSGLRVHGDRVLLLTALNNLIANAISYSPDRTTVSISRRVSEVDGSPMVAIAVTDRGIGIAPADQQRVFERFFRVDKARSRMTGGTGLGLAIVKHVAANHGGGVGLWSRPGTGSTFTLSIPRDGAGPGLNETDAPSTEVASSNPTISPSTESSAGPAHTQPDRHVRAPQIAPRTSKPPGSGIAS